MFSIIDFTYGLKSYCTIVHLRSFQRQGEGEVGGGRGGFELVSRLQKRLTLWLLRQQNLLKQGKLLKVAQSGICLSFWPLGVIFSFGASTVLFKYFCRKVLGSMKLGLNLWQPASSQITSLIWSLKDSFISQGWCFLSPFNLGTVAWTIF